MQNKIIKVPLYPNRLGIILTDDNNINNTYDFFKDQGMPNNFVLQCAATINGWFKEDDGISYKCVYIVLNFSDDELSHGTITHEVIHFVNHVFTDINAKVDQTNDEPQAYLGQWATNCIYSFLKESEKSI